MVISFHGNLSKEHAFDLADAVVSMMGSQTLTQPRWHMRQDIVLPPESSYIYTLTHHDLANLNCGFGYYLQVGDRTRSIADVRSNSS